MISPRNIPTAGAAISCILFVTFFIASATEIPASSSGPQSTPQSSSSSSSSSTKDDAIPTDFQLRRRREAQGDAQLASDSGENDRVLILPILIHQRPIFFINEDLPKEELGLPRDGPTTVSSLRLREVEPADYNDAKVDPDDVWVPSTQLSQGNAGESTTLEYPEVEPLTDMPPSGAIKGNKRYRRENSLSKNDSSESTTQAAGILEIEQWKIGPILVNETNPDTNSSEVGLLSVDVVQINSIPSKGLTNEDPSKQENPSTSSHTQTQPDRRRKRSAPSPRPFTRRLVQAPFRGRRSPPGCGVAAASASASSSSSSSYNGSRGNRGSESNSNAQVQASSG